MQLIADERAGKFGGRTVQLVPHLTGAIQDAIAFAAEGDVHIVEVGGTVGDYESLSFIEAIREFASRVGRENCLYVHVVYVPFIGTSKEFKTKPAQNALNDLRGFGIVPNCVVVRTDEPAPSSVATKIAQFSGVAESAVILLPNAATVYQIPLTIAASGINEVLEAFTGNRRKPNLKNWEKIVRSQMSTPEKIVKIGLVAKYMDNEDTYLSVLESLKSAAWQEGVGLETVWINAEEATEVDFAAVDGLLVPGGFGVRGVEGKIAAATYALDHDIPYLGICLGLQVAVIAAARKAGLTQANSTEFNPTTKEDVVYIMEGQAGKESTGGTLRLGDYTATLKKNSKVATAYDATKATERHRHRYEVNQKFMQEIKAGGLVVSGTSAGGRLVEYIEAPKNDYFVATQAHPEFRSRPLRAHPLFTGRIAGAKHSTTSS